MVLFTCTLLKEYNMKNEETQDFFENFILIFKHPVGGSKFETVHALFFQIIIPFQPNFVSSRPLVLSCQCQHYMPKG